MWASSSKQFLKSHWPLVHTQLLSYEQEQEQSSRVSLSHKNHLQHNINMDLKGWSLHTIFPFWSFLSLYFAINLACGVSRGRSSEALPRIKHLRPWYWDLRPGSEIPEIANGLDFLSNMFRDSIKNCQCTFFLCRESVESITRGETVSTNIWLKKKLSQEAFAKDTLGKVAKKIPF